ncbi:MAG: hypothetical protein KAX49_09180 [Halanaerobiales bacterium]|nr:hypothetical protein [Halanaerobiales bacterium]
MGAVVLEVLEQRIELTLIDLCSKAIVEIMQTADAAKKAFHIYNHQLVKMDDLIKAFKEQRCKIDTLDPQAFSDMLNTILTEDKEQEKVELLSRMMAYNTMEQQEGYDALIEIDLSLTVEYLMKIVRYMKDVKYI